MGGFRLSHIAPVLLVLGLAGCKKAGDAAAGPPSGAVELVPRALLFGNPERASVGLSADGTKIAYLAPVDGVLNVWVGKASAPNEAEPVTQDTKRGIRFYGWLYAANKLVYIQDKDGDENWHLYLVDVVSKQTQDLTPFDGVQARFVHSSPDRPNELLISLNKRDPQLHDVFHVDIDSGELEEVEKNEQGFVGYLADDAFNLKLAVKITPDGGSAILRREGGNWTEWQKVSMADNMTTGPIMLSPDGKTLYMTDSRGRETSALLAVDLQSGEKRVLAEDERADFATGMFHPRTKKPEAAAFNYLRRTWKFLDDSIAADYALLEKVDRGDVHVTDRTLDDATWVVVYERDDGPVRYYLFDRASKKATFLFSNRPGLDGLTLARMYPVVIEARDGLELVSYYSLPPWADDHGKPTQPLPMVLNVHGGPWARDSWGYHPEHQWLANRGYAVLSVNFRGSTGLGKSFINAANGEWAGTMHEDLLDAVAWAVDNGIADPEKIAIYGGSYGGYATLVGLTFTPEQFACGVDIVGPSNLLTLLNTIPPYWQPMIDMFTTRVGDHRTEEGRKLLEERSPLHKADAIVKPLLIAQGANDPRVKQAESDQIVEAMKAKGIPVSYVLYADEGHGFRRPENRMSFYAISESFLTACLGGRAEPFGNAFEGASFTVPRGAEHVPGLAEAMAPAAASN
jgi:dipeptidyl aminopeptidase/acylaminoacyl peptidase